MLKTVVKRKQMSADIQQKNKQQLNRNSMQTGTEAPSPSPTPPVRVRRGRVAGSGGVVIIQ